MHLGCKGMRQGTTYWLVVLKFERPRLTQIEHSCAEPAHAEPSSVQLHLAVLPHGFTALRSLTPLLNMICGSEGFSISVTGLRWDGQ